MHIYVTELIEKGGVCEAVLALDGGSRAVLIAHAPKLVVLLLDEVRREGSDIAVHTALVGLDRVTQMRMLQQPKVRDQLLVDLRVLEDRNAGAGARALLQLTTDEQTRAHEFLLEECECGRQACRPF